jgi:hypothetical protein
VGTLTVVFDDRITCPVCSGRTCGVVLQTLGYCLSCEQCWDRKTKHVHGTLRQYLGVITKKLKGS